VLGNLEYPDGILSCFLFIRKHGEPFVIFKRIKKTDLLVLKFLEIIYLMIYSNRIRKIVV